MNVESENVDRTPSPFPVWDLHVFLMLRPVSPELVLFPDLKVSNIALTSVLLLSVTSFKSHEQAIDFICSL